MSCDKENKTVIKITTRGCLPPDNHRIQGNAVGNQNILGTVSREKTGRPVGEWIRIGRKQRQISFFNLFGKRVCESNYHGSIPLF